MTEQPNLLKLIEAGQEIEVIALLKEGVHLVGAVGSRSARIAIEATERLFDGDFMGTIRFMNHRHPWLAGQTVMERAEQSDEDVQFLLDMIGAIEAGVYI
jgi:hypothetical protein